MAIETFSRQIAPAVQADPFAGTGFGPGGDQPLSFHRTLPGFAPTALRDMPGLAAKIGVSRVLIKDETSRAGLPAFKILGASWAAAKAIHREWLGEDPTLALTFSGIRDAVARLRSLEPDREVALITATDGNHGRAVARAARLFGLAARILVPSGTAQARIDAIASEGADVEVIDGSYDDAVARAAELASGDRLIISDTSWDGYRVVPRDVIDGYSTMFIEVDEQIAAASLSAPTHVVLQGGVGAYPAAGVRHYAGRGTRFIVVEPSAADCLQRSARAGRILEAPGPHDSAMAGLNCGLPSPLVWPLLDRLVGSFVSIGDDALPAAAQALFTEGVAAGESGMAGVAGLLAAARAGRLDELSLGPASTVLFVVTEGVTDPENYERLLAATS